MKKPTLNAGFHARFPSGKLAGFVSHYWLGLDNRDTSYDIVPDGCIDVVLHVDGGRTKLWAYGTSTQLKREAIGPGHYLGIRFRPGMARFFMDVRAKDLTDRREAVARRFAIDMDALSRHVVSTGVFEQLDFALERHLARCEPRPSAIDAATQRIAACNGAVRIEELARRLGKSRRQFEREFLRSVGIPAKQLAVIARFRHAAACLSAQPMDSLAAVAAEAGYADQSHMIRDFQRLGGASPSRWAGRAAFVQDR